MINFNTTPGAGQPWKQQYDFNIELSPNSLTWTTANPLLGAITDSQAIVIKNRVYLLGGSVNGAHSSAVYTAPINADGTLGTWTTANPLPDTVRVSQAIVTRNRVFLLGGIVNDTVSSAVYTATINADGTLGGWTKSASLPDTLYLSHAIVTRNRVFMLGGSVNGTHSSAVYTAPINADGTLGTWTTTNPLPATVVGSHVIVTRNRVFLLGGWVNGILSNTVYAATINADGTLGTWTTTNPLPGKVWRGQAVVTINRVFLIGGWINSVQSNTIYTATINEDGTLGTWTTAGSLPSTVYNSQAIVTKNKVYLLGGLIDKDYSNVVYVADLPGGLNDHSEFY